MSNKLILFSIVALTFACLALAYEPAPIPDFCVSDPESSVKLNGVACKNPMQVQAEDFFFSGLHLSGNTSNAVGSRVTPVFATHLPGLNTLGISMFRIDYAPWGLNPPHTHPRATEILTVLEGSLQVGFVTSNPDNRHISKILQKGDVFVFPVGLVHYQRNVGNGNAVVIAALSSQNPGAITIANTVFGANRSIPSDILARAFQVDKSVADQLQASIVALMFACRALAYEPAPIQDFCVSDPNSSVKLNGVACKNPMQVQAEDFFFSGLHLRGNTSNAVGSMVTPVFATQLPGLNTLGISMVRIDYAPWGLNPPHTHPRATEILTVLEGTLQVGFVTSNPVNCHISKVLQKGDVFVFPVGLVHYQRNVGKGNAVVIAALSSQNPGAITIANAVFGANPSIPSDILARAFQVDTSLVAQLQAKF
uniref:Putative germin-like protein 2-1 n=1 Tax=Tanacetum cinerariifolium TaxID=118510 RepID=A0A6L2LI10_TANCI|nr:putative germin-like protein 2-1 [Tanacetum cinerariifolium]